MNLTTKVFICAVIIVISVPAELRATTDTSRAQGQGAPE